MFALHNTEICSIDVAFVVYYRTTNTFLRKGKEKGYAYDS